MSHKNHATILVAVLILAAGFAYWYFVLREQQAILGPPVGELGGPASFGAELGEKAQNPIKGDLPAIAPEINPIKGLYKNPFE